MANNTSIGNPHPFQNFAKEHKISGQTPKSISALPLHPQLLKANNMTSSAAAGGGNKTGGNMTSSAAAGGGNKTGGK
ncbi:MAG: hypothetical protein DLM72_14175 [Candidatus Nitrosopolaris wilkensis]|nr:MAG: hypothetical protein DLM72_14175 [Candidatus Nitrosopolaris wilkensis]